MSWRALAPRNSTTSVALLLSAAASLLVAQARPTIASIEIEGRRVTREYIIRREIHHPVGAPFDSVLAEEDRDRIDNLQIFSEVRFDVREGENREGVLVYHVIEAGRYTPIPIATNDEKFGWSFGGMLSVRNVRGRNESLRLLGMGGGLRIGAIFFHDPWVAGDHLSLGGQLQLNRFDHPFFPFAYGETDVELTLGSFFRDRWKIWAAASLEDRWTDPLDSLEQGLQQRYAQFKFLGHYDSRDLYVDPSQGMLVEMEIRPDIGLDGASPTNGFIEAQASGYRTVIPGERRWTVGASILVHAHFGDAPDYYAQWVGGFESVRGWEVPNRSNLESERHRVGMHRYVASAELRQVVIPKRVIGSRTAFGILLAEFVDVGTADDRFSHLTKEAPIAGIGVGARMFVPSGELIRLDYGFGQFRGRWHSGVWHFALEHKF